MIFWIFFVLGMVLLAVMSLLSLLGTLPKRHRLRSASGLEIIASAGGGDAEELPEPTDKIELAGGCLREAVYECGHQGVTDFHISVYGIPTRAITERRECPDCLMEKFRKYVIRCAKCGLPIFPGEGVAVYYKTSRLKYAKVGRLEGENYLGCFRWDCCPSGGFFGGHWGEGNFMPLFSDGDSTGRI